MSHQPLHVLARSPPTRPVRGGAASRDVVDRLATARAATRSACGHPRGWSVRRRPRRLTGWAHEPGTAPSHRGGVQGRLRPADEGRPGGLPHQVPQDGGRPARLLPRVGVPLLRRRHRGGRPWVDERSGAIWIHGDLHVENFGTYLNSDGRLVFDVNDFDEAYIGHFTWDLQRFAASLALLGWQKALPDDDIAALIRRYVRAYLAPGRPLRQRGGRRGLRPAPRQHRGPGARGPRAARARSGAPTCSTR